MGRCPGGEGLLGLGNLVGALWLGSVLLAAAAHARKVNTPYVVTPHGMLAPWSLSQGRLKKTLALALGF